jgi:hypothetical protein
LKLFRNKTFMWIKFFAGKLTCRDDFYRSGWKVNSRLNVIKEFNCFLSRTFQDLFWLIQQIADLKPWVVMNLLFFFSSSDVCAIHWSVSFMRKKK